MTQKIHHKIKSAGGRLTKLKKAIIEILSKECCLLSRQELIARLNKQKVNPDRSTIYRELLNLSKNSIIIHSHILGKDYYEIPRKHHHHLICVNCRKISQIEFGHPLAKQEKLIARKNNFNIINHLLEFYGYCHACQKTSAIAKHQ
jgi:Fur family ferric uptake transcriptional regulator